MHLKLVKISNKRIGELKLNRAKAYTSWRTGWIFWKRLEVVLNMAGQDMGVVLDAGCGSGLFLPTLAKYSVLPTGTDRRIEKGSYVLVSGYNTMLYEWDMSKKFIKPTLKFDTVFCLDVLEHLKHPNKAIEELYTALADDGRLIISMPTDSFLYKALSKLTGYKKRSQKEPHINSSKLIKTLIERRFKKIDKKTVYGLFEITSWKKI